MQLEEVGKDLYMCFSSIATERIEGSVVISNVKRFS